MELLDDQVASKAENVVEFYVFCNKLKNVLRKGWQDWHVNKSRLESVAEHIYGVQMLAIAMHSEFGYNLNLEKVIKMLAIHETEEIIIGDVAVIDKNYEEKKQYEDEAVTKLLEPLSDETSKWYLSLWHELNDRETELAKFVYQIDKIDAVMRAKRYAEDYNRPELFDEFYNHQVEAGTFNESLIKDFFDNLKD